MRILWSKIPNESCSACSMRWHLCCVTLGLHPSADLSLGAQRGCTVEEAETISRIHYIGLGDLFLVAGLL